LIEQGQRRRTSAERRDVPAGSLIHVSAGTVLQVANHGEDELVLYIYGSPPEDKHAEILDSVLYT
jgi:hypothetical protein